MREKAEALSRDTIEYLEAVRSLTGCAFNTCLVLYDLLTHFNLSVTNWSRSAGGLRMA